MIDTAQEIAESASSTNDRSANNVMKALLSLAVGVVLLCNGCIADRIMDTEDRRHYLNYRSEAERLNLEREKIGLNPQKIMTFDEWQKK